MGAGRAFSSFSLRQFHPQEPAIGPLSDQSTLTTSNKHLPYLYYYSTVPQSFQNSSQHEGMAFLLAVVTILSSLSQLLELLVWAFNYGSWNRYLVHKGLKQDFPTAGELFHSPGP